MFTRLICYFGVFMVLRCHQVQAADPRYYEDETCVLRLNDATGNLSPSSCITFNDVEAAFFRAKRKVGLRRPATEKSEEAVAQLGLALQETTRILAQRFYLNVNQTDTLLTLVDTSRTEIGKYCAQALRGKERCQEEGYRRHDATCNNLENPSWGASGLPFKRLLLPEYADRISEPRVSKDGYPLPLVRLVSTMVHADKPIRHQHTVTFMFASWGQLVDHDVSLTAETKDPVTRKDILCCENQRHPNCLPIEVPPDDPFFSKQPFKKRCINFLRSLNGIRFGCKLGSRVQTNKLTSYIDASFIYGSNMRTADSLRTLEGGLMKTIPIGKDISLKPLLPQKTVQPDDGCFRPTQNDYCFLAGDNRVNENVGLGVLHTLLVREHNRIATELSKINPYWDDETIYQETRNILAAIVQHITYNEFLPQLLGDKIIEKYNLSLQSRFGRNGFSYDYDRDVDATVPYAFAMAAYRFGHSLLPDKMEKRSSSHHLIGEKILREVMQNPHELYRPGAIDAYTLGMVNQLSQAMDSAVTEEVTNHLFEEPINKLSGRDLAATNLQRAREHGIPGYLAYRKWCGLEITNSWDDLWKLLPNYTVHLYRSIYRNPEDIDLWSAGISENLAPGSMVGPLFTCLIASTFRNLKIGDRFWYENGGFRNSFTRSQLNEIRKYTLSRLLCNTGDNIYTIQRLAMLMPDHERNQRVSCRSQEIPDINLQLWKEVESESYYSEHHLNYEISTQEYTTKSTEHITKPPGFDQLVFNLVNNHQPLKLNSSNSVHNLYSYGDNKSNTFLIKL